MAGFHEVQFPPNISYGAAGGPRRITNIVELGNGFEERNTPWEHSKRTYDASMGMRDVNDLSAVLSFWEARRGQLYGFRWKDWADYQSCAPGPQELRNTVATTDQLLGVGTGALTTFQLVKRYSSGGAEYVRPIKKPVVGTVLVSLNNVNQTSGWTVDTTTGIVTFSSAPGAAVNVKAGFEFDVAVRFDEEQIAISIEDFMNGNVQSIKVKEILI